MQRKKWTPKEVITDADLKFREKRKWQLALRRYVLEKAPSPAYAPYFGIDIEGFRKWIGIQFTGNLNWDNFGKAWQFEHVVPVTYFDFSNREELLLCWNFINIRVEGLEEGEERPTRVDIMAVKPYFQYLHVKTQNPYCLKMLEKIASIESRVIQSQPAIEDFLIENKERLETISTLSHEEFELLNQGVMLKDILLEREILKKFGA